MLNRPTPRRLRRSYSTLAGGGLKERKKTDNPREGWEALLEARTQASVAFFKLGAHSAALRPEFGGP